MYETQKAIFEPRFDGSDYNKNLDFKRLKNQIETIKIFMLDGAWRTLSEIEKALDFPQASISANLRNLKKIRFGGYVLEKQRKNIELGTWQYRILENINTNKGVD